MAHSPKRVVLLVCCLVALGVAMPGCGGSGGSSTPPPLPSGITFLSQPTGVQNSTSTTPVAMQDFSVRVLDANGNPVVGEVTLAIENDPAWGILCCDGENVVLHDPVGDDFTDTGVNVVGWDEPGAATRHPSYQDGAMIYFGRNGDGIGVLAPDGTEASLFTGAYTTIVTVGAAFFDASGRLLVGESETSDTGDIPLYQINPLTGQDTSLGTVTIPGDAVSNWTGVARHPQTGAFYAVIGLNSLGTAARSIMELDPVAMTGANIVALAQPSVTDIAFAPDGTLYATTGNSLMGIQQDHLWTIDDVTTGAMTEVGDFQQAGFGDGAGLAVTPSFLSTTGGAAGLTVTLDENGQATFSGVTIQATVPANGAGFTLRVRESSTNLTSVSDAFTVAP